MNDRLSGYIIHTQPLREADELVNILSPEGIFTFVIKGYHKATSKQTAIGQLFTKVEYLYDDHGKGIATVKSGKLLDSFRLERNNMNWLTLTSVGAAIAYLSGNELTQGQLFNHFDMLIRDQDSYIALSFYLSRILIDLGIAPNIDGCLFCGSEQISGFSIKQGGFICRECAAKQMIHCEIKDRETCRQIRYLFVANHQQFGKIRELYSKNVFVLDNLIAYYEYHTGNHLKSWEFFKKI